MLFVINFIIYFDSKSYPNSDKTGGKRTKTAKSKGFWYLHLIFQLKFTLIRLAFGINFARDQWS